MRPNKAPDPTPARSRFMLSHLRPKMNSVCRRLLRILALIAVAVGGVWLSGVRLFAFPGESMIPSVRQGDYFVGLVGLWRRAPERFDMVIFDVPPTSKWAERKIPWMKRVAGLPGEHVRLSGAHLFINGRKVESSYLHSDRVPSRSNDFEVRLRNDEFCVLGDNLDRSFDDSRTLGPISGSLIKGRAIFVIHRSKSTEPNKGPAPTP
jgi:signal peptidase I